MHRDAFHRSVKAGKVFPAPSILFDSVCVVALCKTACLEQDHYVVPWQSVESVLRLHRRKAPF
jgi:hypothetical protein